MTDPTVVGDKLTALAQRLYGAKSHIQQPNKLSGGASQELWSFDIVAASTTTPLILRRANTWNDGFQAASAGMANEAAVIIAAAAFGGIPVPKIYHVLTPEDGLGDGYIMQRIEGESIPRKILRDEKFEKTRPQLAQQCGQALARIHQIPRANLPQSLRESSPQEERRIYLDQFREFGTVRPVFELAFAWLEDNYPKPIANTLVHADFRNGNLMVDANGISAVLDWELAHFGDPMEDLGMFCMNPWRFGNIDKPAGGFGTREDFYHAYEAAGGTPIDPERVKYWEVLKTLMWGVVCDANAIAFSSGKNRTLERAAIGRRASEAEIDLLQLLAPRF